MSITETVKKICRKDKIILLAAAIVIVIIFTDSFFEERNVKAQDVAAVKQEATESSLESRLARIIEKIDGVGRVEIFISYDGNAVPVSAIVIAEGASEPECRIKIQLAVGTSLGLEQSVIKIFEMGA